MPVGRPSGRRGALHRSKGVGLKPDPQGPAASVDEERRDRFFVRDPRDGLGDELRARELADARAGARLLRERDRVGHDDLVHVRRRDPRDRAVSALLAVARGPLRPRGEYWRMLSGGDALQRMPPTDVPGVMLLNPPYGERIEVAGVAGREQAITEDGGEFFSQLATHWKKNYPNWTAWVLTPDLKLPTRMRLKESRRVPMWNGPIECRMFRFDMVKGSARVKPEKT